MVTDVERDYLWSTYANDPRARINVGIRRRLAPLMDNDRRKIELMNSLLLSFPGTPIIYYGDEIGMGDNIYLGDRNGVRTPMQWTPDRNGGFSRADPARLYAPTIMDPVYGYESVNVEAQSRSLSSLLSATKRLISVRKSTLAFGRGTMTFIRPANRSVLCYVRQYQDEVILCVANLSRSAQATELDLSAWKGRVPLEMLGRTRFPAIGELPYMITLAPYGFYWFQLQERDKSAHGRAARPCPNSKRWWCRWARPGCRWRATRGVFERDVLPGYLARTRWYPERSAKAIQPTLISAIPFCDIGDNRPWLAFFEATQRGITTRYVLPMQIEWVRFDRERYNPRALRRRAPGRAGRNAARRRHRPDLHRAFAAQSRAIADRRESEQACGSNSGRPTASPTAGQAAGAHPRRRDRAIQQHGAGRQRLCRQDLPQARIRHQSRDRDRPLPDRSRRFRQHAGAAGQRRIGRGRRAERDRGRACLCPNQGDAWTVTSAYLDRFVDEQRLLAASDHRRRERGAGPLSALHVADRKARRRDAPGARQQQRDRRFRPGADAGRTTCSAGSTIYAPRRARVRRAEAARDALKEADRPLVDQLLAHAATLPAASTRCCRANRRLNIRHHGDFHLGQMLIVKDDIFIIDFEANPAARSPSAGARRRRRATSPA